MATRTVAEAPSSLSDMAVIGECRGCAVVHLVLGLLLIAGLPSLACGQSPYALSWARDGGIAASAAVLSIGSWLVQEDLCPLTPEQILELSRTDVNPFDRGATSLYSDDAALASDWLLYGTIAAPLGMLADTRVRDDPGVYLLMYAETLALNGALGELVKGLTGRPRPYVYNDGVTLEAKTDANARESFYSNHTSFAFASAVFLMTTLMDYGSESHLAPYGVGLAFASAATVGILRVASGRHFPSDVIVGALVGSLIGWGIPALHRNPVEQTTPHVVLAISLPL